MEIINIFLAGSTKMNAQRNLVRSCANKLQADNCAKGRDIAVNITTFENFTSGITEVKAQVVYDSYIHSVADYAMFIFDNEVGGISKHEFEVAFDAFKSSGKPALYIYFKESGEYCSEYAEIRTLMIDSENYFVEYKDLVHLSSVIESHLREIIEPRIEKIIVNSHKAKGLLSFVANKTCSVVENESIIAEIVSGVSKTVELTEGIHVLYFKDTALQKTIKRDVRVVKDSKRVVEVEFPQESVPSKNNKGLLFFFFMVLVVIFVMGLISVIDDDKYIPDVMPDLGGEKYRYALIAIEEGNTTMAIEHLQNVINDEPSFADPYIHLANIYMQQGDVEKAKGLLDKALELNPDSNWANELYKSISN